MENMCSTFSQKVSKNLHDGVRLAVHQAGITKVEAFLIEIYNKKSVDKLNVLREVQGVVKIMSLPSENIKLSDLHPLLKAWVDNCLKMR